MSTKLVLEFLRSGEFMRSAREAVSLAIERQIALGIAPAYVQRPDLEGPPEPPIVIPLKVDPAKETSIPEATTILFLDFDGVLHPTYSIKAELFCYLPRLESVLRDYPMVKAVVTSDWRRNCDIDEL